MKAWRRTLYLGLVFGGCLALALLGQWWPIGTVAALHVGLALGFWGGRAHGRDEGKKAMLLQRSILARRLRK